ncbi:MAG: hypothetical protein IV105_19920 [Rhizobacter sp.]|nr:hypothetical protein [Rhizobacter sp.]
MDLKLNSVVALARGDLLTKFYIANEGTGTVTLTPPVHGRFVLEPEGAIAHPTMPGCHGMLGWREFLQNRDDLLHILDRAHTLSASRPLQTEHGVAFEAALRGWLEKFLPARYGVTSGFIVPNILDVGNKLYHFDVIVYDKLETPVLWASSNDDQSLQGRQRAIPAKYVASVYEVKATLTDRSVRDAIDKLRELEALKGHFPPRFSSGIVFAQLTNFNNAKILQKLLEGVCIPGFWGGAILRADCDSSMTGLFVSGPSDGTKQGLSAEDLARPIVSLDIRRENGSVLVAPGSSVSLTHIAPNTYAITKRYTVSYTTDKHHLALMWSHAGFAEFAAQIINLLEGIHFWSEQSSAARFADVFDRVD